MKRILLFSIILLFLGGGLFGQNLSFRVVNPRIIKVGTTDRFEFEVEAKSNTAGYYYAALQATFQTTAVGGQYPFLFTGEAFTRKGLSSDPLKYDGFLIDNNTSGRVNISLSSSYTWDPLGGELMDDHFNLMPTDWTSMGVFRLQINSSYTGEITSMVWSTALMNVNNFYQDPLVLGWTLFPTPFTYGANAFQNMYLGRIYCNTHGWSQVGNTSAAQWVDWTQNVNTSVFDTNQAGGHATIPAGTNALAGKLRIHGEGLAGHDICGGRLEIPVNSSLTCSGMTEINSPKGIVTLANATQQGQFIDNGVSYTGGSFEARVYINQNSQWHYYCPAVQLANYRSFYQKYMKYYNEYDATNGLGIQGPYHSFKYIWNNGFTPDTTVLPAMTGYAMWSAASGPYVSDPLSAPSGPVNTGNLSYTVNRSPYPGFTYDGWNMIGNPYPSGLDLDLVTWGDTDLKAYLWTGSGYQVYDAAVPANSTYKPSGTADGIIPPQQAFFVKHTEVNALPTLFAVSNAARVITTNPFMKNSTEAGVDRLFLDASNANGDVDNTVVNFLDVATDEFDETLDAYKMWGNYNAPQLYYPVGDRDLTINVLPWTDVTKVVPASFYCGVSGTYTLTASNVESFGTKHVYLLDKVTSTWQELAMNPVYQFDYTAGEPTSRFELHFMQFALGTGDKELHSMKIYSNEQNLYVMNVSNEIQNGTVELFDMTGRKVFESTLQNSKISKYTPGITEAYYAARVTTPNGVYSGKVYIK